MKRSSWMFLAALLLSVGPLCGQTDSVLAPPATSMVSSDTQMMSAPAFVADSGTTVSNVAVPETESSITVSEPVPAGYSLLMLVGVGLLGCAIGAAGYRLLSGGARKTDVSPDLESEQDPSVALEKEAAYNAALLHNNRLMEENESLRKDMAAMQEQQQSLAAATGEGKDSQPKEIIFYMPQPSRNGKFQEASKRTEADDALYAFRVQSGSPDTASFEFIARDAYLNAAIGNEPSWIAIACERTNQPSATTSQVKTEKPGLAQLNNGEWEIIRKAKITYF